MRTLNELMSLKDRVALVTGGAGHIGSVLCEALAELGAAIAVLDVNERIGSPCAERLSAAHGIDAMALGVDLENEDETRAAPRQVVERLGRLDILVNCAALVGTSRLEGWTTPFEEQSADTWRRALEVNLTAPFVLAQAAAAALAASGHGSIVNIGSVYGMVGPQMSLYDGTDMGMPAAYAASKGGLIQLTRYLATVLAPEVRVNALTVGGVRRDQPDVFRERYEAHVPAGRMATEEDLKGAIAYLASDLSQYVTGHNLVVDGGWTVW